MRWSGPNSRVLEINPGDPLELVWSYQAPGKFFATNIRSAQRLENGNTLITEGPDGRLFEVAGDGKIVWEYINPLFSGPQASNAVYRAYRLPYSWIPQLPHPLEKVVVAPWKPSEDFQGALKARLLPVEPRPIEAADAPLATGEHGAGILDPTGARLRLLGADDPVDPVPARNGCERQPQRARLWGGGQRLAQIGGDPGFQLLFGRRDLHRYDVAHLHACCLSQLGIQPEPVTHSAVRLECCPKGKTVDRSFHRRHASGRQLHADALWHGKKEPGAAFPGGLSAQQFRFESHSKPRDRWARRCERLSHPMRGHARWGIALPTAGR